MKKKAVLVCVGILMMLAIVGSYFLGYKTAYDRLEAGAGEALPQTFYATITEREGDHFAVEGLSVNDINFRGEFTFTITPDTSLIWRGETLPAEELQVGDRVAVTFDGTVQEVYPAVLTGVLQVQLLEDER
ncbi:MAG TPA: DUF3221 domain-containing protein [Firmicutes bacterium]|nr:DUF3221 domain-containing protein [Bacillota bacterium]